MTPGLLQRPDLHPGLRFGVRQLACPVARRLPARQPLLGPAVVRDRDLPGRRAGPGRALLMVDRPASPRLTRLVLVVAGSGGSGEAGWGGPYQDAGLGLFECPAAGLLDLVVVPA